MARQRVHQLRSMATFPRPLAELRGRGRVGCRSSTQVQRSMGTKARSTTTCGRILHLIDGRSSLHYQIDRGVVMAW